MTEKSYAELSADQQELLDAAERAMETAFNPGSAFVVGAAVRTVHGKIYRGANMKISSTGMVACAEVAAFLTANTAGDRLCTSIAVIARHGERLLENPNMPCGRCAQIIHEFSQLAGAPMEMIYSNTAKDRVMVAPVTEFLPHPFVSGIFRDRDQEIRDEQGK